MLICVNCNSTHVVKFGRVPTRKGVKQRYRCQKCGRTFYNLSIENVDKISVEENE